jgi:thiamine-phosphate pyrophosphorylase
LNSDTKLLINDRADIAIAAGADGVHLRTESVAANFVRESFGAEFLIGVSAHTLEEVSAATKNGADFVVFGPIFESHSDAVPKGIDPLAKVVNTVGNFPVIALGGVNETNFEECFHKGAAGVAGIRLFSNSQKLRELVPEIRSKYR